MSAIPRELSSEEREKLIQAAISAKETAYSPYSKFRVGAALFSTDGKIIAGGNVENASYGGTICAERTALVKAVSEGTKTFLAIAVTSDVDEIVSPCGICRQFIREFCSLKMPIYMVKSSYTPASAETASKIVSLEDILPYSFGPEHLEMPRN
ncbi:cytidine and deoxycytidylate deaminase zinc-binding region protein [Rhizoctonia solani AG-3 Rhs1AP]|uniref:Cytidine deaminase n=2 Tax=Rhizoctonia solani AG-3 TaxID=1086053 RepID=A0A074RYW5_9AGAM|nr:cytidine and deoxycytidylate deaminase zinc-binding region protein [Rhizoctonia solani AG-3 Rhs1AP]KEP49823.1 cytidine and deoxycytidylate deaminase zinc-binding region protein [Rhizoctonia solani 123E]